MARDKMVYLVLTVKFTGSMVAGISKRALKSRTRTLGSSSAR